MKILKRTKAAPPAPLVRPPKVETFFERMKEFEDAMMRRVYELFGPFTGTGEIESLFPEYGYLPALHETEDGLVLSAEVPGFKEKELEVQVEPWRVYITGEREETTEEKKGKALYSERTAKQIARWFELPAEVDPEKVKATLNNGVLEIRLQKAQPAKRIPVEIKAA